MLVQASPSTHFQSWSFTLKIWKILSQVFASDVNENNKSNSSTDCYPALTLESPVYRYGRVASRYRRNHDLVQRYGWKYKKRGANNFPRSRFRCFLHNWCQEFDIFSAESKNTRLSFTLYQEMNRQRFTQCIEANVKFSLPQTNFYLKLRGESTPIKGDPWGGWVQDSTWPLHKVWRTFIYVWHLSMFETYFILC